MDNESVAETKPVVNTNLVVEIGFVSVRELRKRFVAFNRILRYKDSLYLMEVMNFMREIGHPATFMEYYLPHIDVKNRLIPDRICYIRDDGCVIVVFPVG